MKNDDYMNGFMQLCMLDNIPKNQKWDFSCEIPFNINYI